MLALGAAAVVLLAACSGTSGPSWTVAPVTPPPTVVAGAPVASGSPAAGSPAAPGSTAPSGTGAPATATAPSAPGASGAPAGGSPPAGSPAPSAAAGNTIELEETETLTLLQNGQPVNQLNVKVGDTVTFVIHNSADFDHTFYIGTADALKNDQIAGLPGLADFQGTQQFTYTVTAATAGLQFGCSLEGHYDTMHGDFVVAP